MQMDFTDKYLKYKTKYIDLHDNMVGGKKKIKKSNTYIKSNIESSILELDGLQSIIISKSNNTIYEYGNIKYNHGYIASCRKSILAILYGMYPINLDKTLKELNIDDKLGLSDLEKTATIRDLLSAKSGIYHPASNPGDSTNKPKRYSMKPGEHFTYNNWDFNALGTIFTQETGSNIFDALGDLGKKIGFEDFDLEYNKEQYKHYIARIEDKTESIHPPYHFYLSARDMLKLGYLMLNKGKYNDKQIVPEAWIDEITSLKTKKTDQENLKHGYGYMWWVFDEEKEHPLWGAYMASGHGGQRIIIIPKSDMVIVMKNYQYANDLLEKIFNIKL